MLSYHAVGSLVGDQGLLGRFAAKYANMVGYRNATGQSTGTFDYDITGSYEDWTIQKLESQVWLSSLAATHTAALHTIKKHFGRCCGRGYSSNRYVHGCSIGYGATAGVMMLASSATTVTNNPATSSMRETLKEINYLKLSSQNG